MENYVIFVAGPPAAGKTKFSEYLSEKLRVLCVNKDFVKEVLCDTIGFADRAENKTLSTATFKLFLLLLEKSMKAGQPLILESNFTPDEGSELAALLSRYSYKTLTVLFHGEPQTLYRRFLDRLEDRVNVRHAAHRSVSFVKFEDFRDVAANYLKFDVGGPLVAVDTTDFENVDYESILNILRVVLDILPSQEKSG